MAFPEPSPEHEAAIQQIIMELEAANERIVNLEQMVQAISESLESFEEREERGERMYGVKKYGKKPSKGWGLGGFFYWGRVRPFPATFVMGLLTRRVVLKSTRAALKYVGIPTTAIGIFLLVVMPIIDAYMKHLEKQMTEEQRKQLEIERAEILSQVFEVVDELEKQQLILEQREEELREVYRGIVPG